MAACTPYPAALWVSHRPGRTQVPSTSPLHNVTKVWGNGARGPAKAVPQAGSVSPLEGQLGAIGKQTTQTIENRREASKQASKAKKQKTGGKARGSCTVQSVM